MIYLKFYSQIFFKLKLKKKLFVLKNNVFKKKVKFFVFLPVSHSPNSNQICLTGVSQYGPIFDGFFITAQKMSLKTFFRK